MLRELACADDFNRDHLDGFFSDADLWRMATLNNAVALGAQGRIGAIAPGLAADIAIFDGSQASHHRAVLEAEAGDVALVLRGGTPLYGESDVVAGLGRTWRRRRRLRQRPRHLHDPEWNTPYASIVNQAAGSYPAWFCATPTDEPTCTPARPGEFTGALLPADNDGDGIGNAADNCPDVFNPIRPIDGGAQPDADADGMGDACDPTPLPADIDGDGLPNLLDNCPLDANAGQDDLDGDGTGDSCDFCPDVANPDTVCPPAVVSIPDIRAGTATGTVEVEGVVTGVGQPGLHPAGPHRHRRHERRHLRLHGRHPHRGPRRRDPHARHGRRLLRRDAAHGPTITPLGTMVLAPVPVTVAEAATEAYEGVLVTLTDGTVTDLAYDCSVDGSCADPNLWEIDGATGVVVFDRLYEDADWAAQVGVLPVTGVMGFRWNRRRIMPRTTDDFGL